MNFEILTDYKEKEFPERHESKDKRIEIIFGQYDEPHYGRQLRKFDLTLESLNITDKYCNQWNYTQILKQIDFGFQFTDSANEYIFIPHETEPKVLATSDLSVVFDFRNENRLITNYFTKDKFLILETNKTIELIDLINKSHEVIDRKKIGERWIQATNKIGSGLILITDREIIYFSLATKEVSNYKELVKPSIVFNNDLYIEYDKLENHEDRGYLFSVGNKSTNKQILDLSVNSWGILEFDREGNILVLGTIVPTEFNKRDYTYWFSGQNHYIKLGI